MIRGETVILLNKTVTGTDPFGGDIYTETEISVDNVIIGTPSTEDEAAEINISGKKISFVLGIPKGDTNDWQDKIVKIRGVKYKTYGFPLTQTAANVPGKWNTQVKVERYE